MLPLAPLEATRAVLKGEPLRALSLARITEQLPLNPPREHLGKILGPATAKTAALLTRTGTSQRTHATIGSTDATKLIKEAKPATAAQHR